ncbi:MAG: hypothetical protein B7C24_02115 [Bacteroidetes bacterium 4572_77]|nr:MAG: hypothetical protein B7C24_02115 [Bacteroidetes bacterium 4572_77]
MTKQHTNHLSLTSNDKELWQQIRQKNPNALELLFKKYYEDLFFYGLKISQNKNTVADAIQDIFLLFWSKANNLSSVSRVKPYLFIVLRNHLLFLQNKNTLCLNLTDDSILNNSWNQKSPEDLYLEKENSHSKKQLIPDLLKSLSPHQSEILHQKYFENYSVLEIGKIHHIKPQSVSNILHRSLEKLRHQIKKNKN